MSRTMNDKDLEQFKAHVTKLAKGLKSEADLGDLTQQLMKMTVEAALGAELDEHLGYDKHDPAGRGVILRRYRLLRQRQRPGV